MASLIKLAAMPTVTQLYRSGKLTASPKGSSPPASQILNNKICTLKGDITTLDVDAIVNAAKSSLLGGAGVDGAIHRAAGPGLVKECETLNGCDTGFAKITNAYRLPCKKVIHTVGPVYYTSKAQQCETLLRSCYRTSLQVAVDNDCRSVAFPAISTGVYGYPNDDAAFAVLDEVRQFLEQPDGDKIDKVIFCNFLNIDISIYAEALPQFFPPTEEDVARSVCTSTPCNQHPALTTPDTSQETESIVNLSHIQITSPQSTMAQDEGSSSPTAKEPTQEDKVEKADEPARLGIESDNLVGGDDPDDTKLLGGRDDKPGGINPPDGDIKRDDRTGLDHRVQNVRFEEVRDFETTVGKETGMIALADTNVIGCIDVQAEQDTPKCSQERPTTNLECSEYVDVKLREACEKILNGTKEEQRDILSTTGKTEDVVATVREIHEDIDVQESVVA